MAIREMRFIGDPILGKRSKEVAELTPRLKDLIRDMQETMHEKEGVGIAAVQVGVLKRIICIETDEENSYVFINPVITSSEGEAEDNEGCLSVPGKVGKVIRPEKVTVEALDEDMQPFTLEAEGLLARAVCHECDHLEGVLYVDKVVGELMDAAQEPEEVTD